MDSCETYTHGSMTAVYRLEGAFLTETQDLEPNEVCERPIMIRDRRQRELDKIDGQSSNDVHSINVRNSRASSIQRNDLDESRSEESHFYFTYVPVCPITESSCGSFFNVHRNVRQNVFDPSYDKHNPF